MKLFRSTSSLCLLICASISSAIGFLASATAAESKTVRVLTIGASMTQNATQFLGNVAEADGNRLIQGRALVAGSSLGSHWAMVEKHEADPLAPAGLYLTKHGLKEMLTSEPWDYVTFQQASYSSHDLASYRPHAKHVIDYIHRYAPKAKALVYQTPGYRRDHLRFVKPKTDSTEPKTQAEMYDQLTHAYRTIAAEFGLDLIPVGNAFRVAETDPDWGFQVDTKFDPKTALEPELPDQTHSLHIGWEWKKNPTTGKASLVYDGLHGNTAGRYLGACVFYESLFTTSVVGNKFVPEGLRPADARYLQQVAHQAVEHERIGRKN